MRGVLTIVAIVTLGGLGALALLQSRECVVLYNPLKLESSLSPADEEPETSAVDELILLDENQQLAAGLRENEENY